MAPLAASSAQASTPPPYLSVTGEGGGVIVNGYYFTAGVSVRVEVLNSNLTSVVATRYLTAWQGSGSYGVFSVLVSTNYTGKVLVAADQAGHPTEWATTTVFPPPHIDSAVAGPTLCGAVAVRASGFYPGATVRFELLDAHMNVLDTQYVTALQGDVYAGTVNLTLASPRYVGPAFVVSDGGGPAEAWAQVSTC
jgi:hypothetical protein